MNEITPIEHIAIGGRAAFPVDQIDALDAEVRSIIRLANKGLELPSSAAQTAAQARSALKPATRNAILDAFGALAGIFGQRGDAEVWATLGVKLVEAEHPSHIGLASTVLALIRPTPAIEGNQFNGFQDQPAVPRKFTPTLSEFIAELCEQDEGWRERVAHIEKLLERRN